MRLAVAPLGLAVVAVLVSGCRSDDGNGADPSSLEEVPWVLTAGVDVEGWEEAAPSASFEGTRSSSGRSCRPRWPARHPRARSRRRSLRRSRASPAGARRTTSSSCSTDDGELLRFGVATPVGSWLATGFLNGDAFTSPIVGTELTATFAEGDELTGSAGCNTYRATHTSDAGPIEISAPATTRRLCTEPEGVMEQEAAYVGALASAMSYRIDGGTLELTRADGTRVVHFTQG